MSCPIESKYIPPALRGVGSSNNQLDSAEYGAPNSPIPRSTQDRDNRYGGVNTR